MWIFIMKFGFVVKIYIKFDVLKKKLENFFWGSKCPMGKIAKTLWKSTFSLGDFLVCHIEIRILRCQIRGNKPFSVIKIMYLGWKSMEKPQHFYTHDSIYFSNVSKLCVTTADWQWGCFPSFYSKIFLFVVSLFYFVHCLII